MAARLGRLLIVLLSMSSVARADKKDKRAEANAHIQSGMRKFEVGKYDEAAEEFVQAYEAVGDPPSLLYNIGQAYRLAEKFDKAAQFYRSFLRKVPDVANRAEIEGRIVEMDERAADQKRQADRRAAEQREAERKEEQRRREAALHKTTPGEPDAKPEPKGPEPAPREITEDDRPRPGRTLKIVGYALCGLTGAALGVGIAMTVLAVQASHKVQDAAARGDVFDTSLRDTESKGQVFDKVQYAGYAIAGVAAVGAGLAIYFGFRAEKQAGDQQRDETPPSQAALRRRLARMPILAPAIDSHGGGFVLEGRF